jgi:hypothetical protein
MGVRIQMQVGSCALTPGASKAPLDFAACGVVVREDVGCAMACPEQQAAAVMFAEQQQSGQCQ